MPRVEKYDLGDFNGIRWWRLVFAPLDFLIDPGLWIWDTRVVNPENESPIVEGDPLSHKGVRFGPYRVALLLPQLYFDHGKPRAPWIVRRLRRFAKRVANPS